MLTITFVEDFKTSPSDTILDVEMEFARRTFNPSSDDIRIIKMIENAEVSDSGYLIDRFGVRFFPEGLSTGCKAALLVKPEGKPVSLEECGYNAIHFIINYCDGAVVTRVPQGDYMDYCEGTDRTPIFLVNGVELTTVPELNAYMDGDLYEN